MNILTPERAAQRLGENFAMLLCLKKAYSGERSALVESGPVQHLIADIRAMADMAGLDPDAAERGARAVL